MKLLPLAWKSLRNRRTTVFLTVFAIACSVALLLSVERLRSGVKESFTHTISGTDLIVGARSGSIQLLLSSVFHIGNATTNVSWETYQKIAGLGPVAWVVPLSLGDSYQGFRVLGTSAEYFKYYQVSGSRDLKFSTGHKFENHFDAVLGSDVATELGHVVGDKITISHGLGEIGNAAHGEDPFTITGVLAKTGTPVDRTVHISLQGLELVHEEFLHTGEHMNDPLDHIESYNDKLVPEFITAFMVGLKSRSAVFGVLRTVNTYQQEPLLAIMPGVTLQELWETMKTVETALRSISLMVVATGLLGMVTVILAGLNERRREMAIFRSVGAKPRQIFNLMVTESTIVAALGALTGLGIMYSTLLIIQPIINTRFGLYIPITFPGLLDLAIVLSVVGAGFLTGFIPGIRAYRYSVADGMTVRT